MKKLACPSGFPPFFPFTLFSPPLFLESVWWEMALSGQPGTFSFRGSWAGPFLPLPLSLPSSFNARVLSLVFSFFFPLAQRKRANLPSPFFPLTNGRISTSFFFIPFFFLMDYEPKACRGGKLFLPDPSFPPIKIKTVLRFFPFLFPFFTFGAKEFNYDRGPPPPFFFATFFLYFPRSVLVKGRRKNPFPFSIFFFLPVVENDDVEFALPLRLLCCSPPRARGINGVPLGGPGSEYFFFFFFLTPFPCQRGDWPDLSSSFFFFFSPSRGRPEDRPIRRGQIPGFPFRPREKKKKGKRVLGTKSPDSFIFLFL